VAKLFPAFIIALLCFHLCEAQEYVFIGSYNKKKANNGIYVYTLDTASGSLKKIAAVRNIHNPSYITLSPDGRYLYACTESLTPVAGSVAGFSFDKETEALTFINSRRSGGENPVYLSVHQSGKWLVNGNYTEGSVAVFPLGEDGSIKAISQRISYSDGSINKERQERAHIHATVFSPRQDYLFLPDLGADKIRCYRFDVSRLQPLQPAQRPLTGAVPGSGPRHIAFHPFKDFAYCIEELSGTITAYRYTNGSLDSIQRIDAHPASITAGFSSADIHLSPDGLFLYASNRGEENNISIFSVDPQTGKLTGIGYQPTMGDHPRNFAIDPVGKFLLVANQFTGNVVVFNRDIRTGLLKYTGVQVKVPGASCVQIKDY
jgi:6-phosphogluconolactonase